MPEPLQIPPIRTGRSPSLFLRQLICYQICRDLLVQLRQTLFAGQLQPAGEFHSERISMGIRLPITPVEVWDRFCRNLEHLPKQHDFLEHRASLEHTVAAFAWHCTG